MSDWPIKRWSFFISIKKIATSNLPKTLSCPNMCCALKKKQEARSTVISAASPASASEPTESIFICASDKQVKMTSVKNVRLTYQALEFLHQHQEDSNFKFPKNTHLPKHVLCTKKKKNKKHGAQSYQLQVQQVQVSQQKASLFVPLTSKWKWRQSRMSDWPIKRWSFFISIKKIATSNFPKTLICPNMCCAQKKQEAPSTVISAASPASASEPTESIFIRASDKQVKMTSVKNVRLTYQALEFLHQHQEDSNFKFPKNTHLPKHVLCTKRNKKHGAQSYQLQVQQVQVSQQKASWCVPLTSKWK